MSYELPVVAIDGPSGSGKSTVARGVARRCSLRYLDTGATYRAVTVRVLEQEIDLSDAAAVAGVAQDIVWDIRATPDGFAVLVDGADVAEAIRSSRTTAAVSAVAAVPAVRRHLVDLARSIIGPGGIVVEGRDIATVVAPEAPVKVHLTADPEVRASRRAAELGRADAPAVAIELARRDLLDSTRTLDPLTVSPGSTLIDASHRTPEEIIDQISALVLGL